MTTINTTPRFIQLTGRDTSFPLDKDGCATEDGVRYLVNVAQISMISQNTYRRGETRVHLAGDRRPLDVCEQLDEIADMLTSDEPDEAGENDVDPRCMDCGAPCLYKAGVCEKCAGVGRGEEHGRLDFAL